MSPRRTLDGQVRPPTGRPDGAPLLEATDLVKEFPVPGGILGRTVAKVHAVSGVDLQVAPGRDARRRRRVGLRQVDPRPAAAEPDPASTSGTVSFEGQRDLSTSRRKRDAPAAPAAADGVPGPVRVAQPPHDASATALAEPFRVHEGMSYKDAARTRSPQLLETGRALARAPQPLPPRVLRRPAPAHRHRPGPRPRTRR